MNFKEFKNTSFYHSLCSLAKSGTLVFISGETARKIYSDLSFTDINIVTNSNRIDLAKEFENIDFVKNSLYDAYMTLEDAKIFFSIYPPAYLSLDKWLQADIRRRIFLPFALYLDPLTENFIDIFGAISEIEKNKLSLINSSVEILKSEPFTALKSITTAACYQIIPDARYFEAIKSAANYFSYNKEMMPDIKNELSVILTQKNPYIGIWLLSESGFLGKIFPEIEKLKNIPHEKDFHPEGNAYEHTIECFKYLEKPSLELALAVLFHDAGKVNTIQPKNARYKFPNHALIGARIAAKALNRIGFDKECIKKTEFMINFHMFPPVIPNMPIHRTRDILDSENFDDLMKLYWADLSSSYTPPNDYFNTKSFYETYIKKKNNAQIYTIKKKI